MNQLQIISKLTGFPVVLNKRICNPWRPDNTPGCWFEYYRGYVRIADFASPLWHNANMYDMVFIPKHGRRINGRKDFEVAKKMLAEIIKQPVFYQTVAHEKWDMRLIWGAKNYTKEDLLWWLKYGITKEQLLEDKTYSVQYFKHNSKAMPNVLNVVEPDDLCFAYKYNGGSKIYRPQQHKKSGKKWMTGCTNEDIRFEDSKSGKDLLLIGSYKDARIAKNLEFDVRELQSENTHLPPAILLNWQQRYDTIWHFGDCDPAGHRIAEQQLLYYNSIGLEVKKAVLPPLIWDKHKLKDLGEIYEKWGARLTKLAIEKSIG